MTDLERSHAELRAALRIAGKRIRQLQRRPAAPVGRREQEQPKQVADTNRMGLNSHFLSDRIRAIVRS
jgi:hypothetical protein